MNNIMIKNYPEAEIDRRKILRYLGVRGEISQIEELLMSCLSECKSAFKNSVAYIELPLKIEGETLRFEDLSIRSSSLAKHLSGCKSAIIFTATVGIEIDRLITKYSKISPSRSTVFQAIGAERIESLADAFEKEIIAEKEKNGLLTRSRFSPGYGDLPLEFQKEIFTLLDCPRKIGLTLNDSMLMTPSKSVSAIIGIKKGSTHETS